jgi:hypothetical protein
LWSTNPDGEPAILTLTAPFGYIRSNNLAYWQIIKEEFAKASLGDTPVDQWEDKIRAMANTVSERCAKVMSDAAPIDSGDLRSSIEGVDTTDPLLKDTAGTSFDMGAV